LNVRILADGQVAKQFDHVHYGAAAEPVTIDVSGKKEISLEVDFGDNSPAQGRFLWLDPAFLKVAPATQPGGQ
ncbi:MAG: NPCBM/NEW2 domain-containing protein, partial [Tepidisphaeraceae bacterium]